MRCRPFVCCIENGGDETMRVPQAGSLPSSTIRLGMSAVARPAGARDRSAKDFVSLRNSGLQALPLSSI
jgi:hypothetical protein